MSAAVALTGAAIGGACGLAVGRILLGMFLRDLEKRSVWSAARAWPFNNADFSRRWGKILFLALAPLTFAWIGARLALTAFSGSAAG